MRRTTDPAILHADISAASAVLGTDPERAGELARNALRAAPDDPRALLVLASSLRRLGDVEAAKELLVRLAARFPRAPLTQYELGLTHAALHEDRAAIASLERAVQLQPDLADAWKALGDLYFIRGDEQRARTAFAGYERATIVSPGLKVVGDRLMAGEPREAELLLRAHLTGHPDDVEALGLLARAVARQDREAEAEALFDLCLRQDPGNDGIRFSYAEILFRRNKGEGALSVLRSLVAKDSEHPAYRNLLAATLDLTGEHDEAIRLYEGLIAQFKNQARIWLNYGHALRNVRQPERTIAAYRTAIALRPDLGEAYWSLANLKHVAFTAQEEASMLACAEAAPSIPDRFHVHFALGKALEDRGDYEGSFRHYAAGANLRRNQSPYDAEHHAQRLQAIAKVATPTFFAKRVTGGFASDEPIFIVGLPRAGSTLVEQILASHSAIEGTRELSELGLIAADLGGAGSSQGFPEALAALSPQQRSVLGQAYIERTRVYRKLGRRFFIDKTPDNFLHIPLIELLLPNARIIDVRRHPMAACFSAFKQHFHRGQDFSYDLEDLGRYYCNYIALMAHFDEVLPGRIHRVLYEDLIADAEQEVRRLLDYCLLPFEESCLRFYENRRAVRTASSEQVRQPLHGHALEHWRHYEPWLAPLSAVLGECIDNWQGAQLR
ncbi:MAG: tetratricopeptide repeat protein [Bradyrhizobium sp.]|nr:tetratricopeptide repeat protein [Bradyrhizobium sp.]